MVVYPAYGVTYSSKEEVLKAWQNNADFKIKGGPYVSKNTWEEYGNLMDSITYAYGGLAVNLVTGIIS